MKATFLFQKILLAFFVFIGLLIAIRIIYTGSMLYLFLVWNLFLAWIPLMISNYFVRIYGKSKWKQALVFSSWLVFFPNALYIVTDLIHLQTVSTIPKWFDAVLLFSSSFVGLLMAFVSLYRVEKYLLRIMNRKMQSPLIILILFLGSFGVYLGRFLRWNSWDILSNPLQLFVSIGQRIISPIEYLHTWGITLIFTVFFYLLYVSIKKLPGYLSQANN